MECILLVIFWMLRGSILVKKHRVLLLVLISLVVISPFNVRAGELQNLQKLTIGYPALVTTLATIAVIQKGGFFKKHGLDVDLCVHRRKSSSNSGDGFRSGPDQFRRSSRSGRLGRGRS